MQLDESIIDKVQRYINEKDLYCEENVVNDKTYGNIKGNQKRMELYIDDDCKVTKCVIVDGTKRAGEENMVNIAVLEFNE